MDGFEGADPTTSCGHVVEIPGFGRITLGELRVSPVLTAHPTEVRRKSVLEVLGRVNAMQQSLLKLGEG